MGRAVILVGKLNHISESYQFMIGLEYSSGIYIGSEDRAQFYDEFSDFIVQKVLNFGSNLQLGVLNGWRIGEAGNERIGKLEEHLVEKLSGIVKRKIIENTSSQSI